MTQELSIYDPIRPIAPRAKWWIVGAVVVVLGLWELVFHWFLMDLPMLVGHRVSFLMGAGLVTGVVLAFFRLIQDYEQELARATAAIREKNEALRALEAERDTRLLNLAGDLAVALADITQECEIALNLGGPKTAVESLTTIKARSDELQTVIRALIDLRRHGVGLTEYLPAVLDDYQRHRDARVTAA
jgi:signal transduction histidine kinase